MFMYMMTIGTGGRQTQILLRLCWTCRSGAAQEPGGQASCVFQQEELDDPELTELASGA